MSVSFPPGPTPAAPADPTAVMGRRVVAWIVDLALWMAIIGGLFASHAEYVEVPEGFQQDACARLEAIGGDEVSSCFDLGDRAYVISDDEAGIQTLASLGYLAFFIVVQGAVGASPGKLVLGLRVVRPDGRRAGVGRSFARTLLWVVDGVPWFAPLVGAITGLTTNGHRRVGDMVAGTHVVAAKSVGVPVVTPSQGTPATSWGAPAPGPPPSTPPPFSAPSSPSPPADPGGPSGGFVAPDAPDHATAPAAERPETDTRSSPSPYPEPQWDVARNTYIQWDPHENVWLQWDDHGSRWKPIDS